MKISVVLIDGGFRENFFALDCLTRQVFPREEFEILWVDFYDRAAAASNGGMPVRGITLGNPRGSTYHSSYCFNRGIREAKGELLVIPDPDQILAGDFLHRLWEYHRAYDRLVVYPYRYDENQPGSLKSFESGELAAKCSLQNPLNYGGCLSVRKKWMLEINGYEQHPAFATGHHANGRDVYTRLKNLGLAILWAPEIKMYHPWHPLTRTAGVNSKQQREIIEWRARTLQYLALQGIDPERNAQELPEKLLTNQAGHPSPERQRPLWHRFLSFRGEQPAA